MEFVIPWALDGYVRLLSIIIPLLIFGLYIYFRAGSGYTILHRIWSFISGLGDFNHPKIKSMMDDRNDIERYNVIFNGNATNINQILNFKQWSKKYDINIIEISKAKQWFDIVNLKVNTPSNMSNCVVMAGVILLYLLTMFFTNIGLSKSALLTFNSDNQPFWLGYNSASNFYPGFLPFAKNKSDWTLTKGQCIDKKFNPMILKETSGLSDEQINIICTSFSDSEQSTFIKNTISEQKYILLFSLMFSLLMLYSIVKLSRRFSSASAKLMVDKKIEEYNLNSPPD
ncbi:hypothetical protein FCL49_03025 [Serratia proteamaculans]|uniref:DUF6216 family protein n=1 Tax=Serratia proteamaculans TaxID=28151 RepID=UPI0015762060|nr:DUF6216 family protein [Serratia proteamaculans]NTX78690.1 hypothetical protein [Serratia proteamaculans]NTZ27069.1 hypothetical protein [Serratia proteamaculans]